MSALAEATRSGAARDALGTDRRPRRRPRDVYVYFDNDAKVRAPFDAQSLRRKLGKIS